MDAVEKIYAQLPVIQCRGLCSESCGPIVFSKAEADRMARKSIKPPAFDETGTCTALRADRCSIYKNRPYVCRLWGVIKSMACPHGCRPAEYVTKEASDAHLAALGPLRAGDLEILQAFEEFHSKP